MTARAWAQASEWDQYRARKAEAKAARAEAAAMQPDDEVPAAPVAPVVLPAPRPAPAPVLEPETADVDQELVLEDLTPGQVRDWRVRAMKDHQVVFDHIDSYGEPSARRLFSNQLVNQVQHHARLGHLNLGYSWGGQS